MSIQETKHRIYLRSKIKCSCGRLKTKNSLNCETCYQSKKATTPYDYFDTCPNCSDKKRKVSKVCMNCYRKSMQGGKHRKPKENADPILMFQLLKAFTKSKLENKNLTEEERSKYTKDLFLLEKMKSDYEQTLLSELELPKK